MADLSLWHPSTPGGQQFGLNLPWNQTFILRLVLEAEVLISVWLRGLAS